LSGEKREAIASSLGIRPRTVRYHLEHVRQRFGLNGTIQVVVFFASHPDHLDTCQKWQLTLPLDLE